MADSSVLQYLYSLTNYEKEPLVHYDTDTLDLSRVVRVLARLGNPHQHFSSIHVAGTKGKGSTAAMCASALQAAGLRTGLYTSPHLHSFRERIQVDGELISAGDLSALVAACRPVCDSEPQLTTFEAVTALAFSYFASRQVDLAVVEVGLGGRLDATNVITPKVSIITSISYDHTYLLGNTLAEIAREKAGIIKPGIPVVCSPQDAEALAVVQQACDERAAPLTLIGRDWTWQPHGSSHAIPAIDQAPEKAYRQPFKAVPAKGHSGLEGTYAISLMGRHQMSNGVTALAALDLLQRAGVPLSANHARQGFANVQWPGRFEILRPEPLLIVDGAHNVDSVSRLVEALQEWFPDQRWTFIVGTSRDKDLTGMLHALAPLTKRLLATQSRHERALLPQKVAETASRILPQHSATSIPVAVASDAGAALALAFQEMPVDPVCVTGSIFLVADVREVWALYTGHDAPATDQPLAQGLTPLTLTPTAHPETANP